MVRVFYVVVFVFVVGVFYVVLLVLEVGGWRTESEGTVFNNIQLLESMSNVTVSSSKLVIYDFSYLVMQWPRSFCINRQCNQPVPARFTVHGLWPQYSLTQSVDCGLIHRQPHQLFNIRLLRQSLVPGLDQYWLDLTKREKNNQGFWKAEYNKHGSCTFINQDEYFYSTLKMVAHLGDLALKLSLIRGGPIIPNDTETYSVSYIKGAVRRITSKLPRLQCNKVDNKIQLLEIRFCAHQNGILFDCDNHSNCGNGRIYLPKP